MRQKVVKGIYSKLYRKLLGMTQKDLADYLGVAPITVHCWENGKSLPNVDELYRMSRLFNVTMEELCIW